MCGRFYVKSDFGARVADLLRAEGIVPLSDRIYEEIAGSDVFPSQRALTTSANDSMIKVHDRMPVMIGQEEIKPWITDDSRISDFLTRQQAELVCEMDSGQMRMEFGI